MKQYRLRKDLPNVKAGTVIQWYDTKGWNGGPYKGGRYTFEEMPSDKSCNIVFAPEDVENNPEWFEEVLPVSEPVKEKVKALSVSFESNTNLLKVFINKPVNKVVAEIGINELLDRLTKILNNNPL